MGMTLHPPAGGAPRFPAGLLARACVLSLSACGPTEAPTPARPDAATPSIPSGPFDGGPPDSSAPDSGPPDSGPPDLSRLDLSRPDLLAHPVDLSQPTTPGQRTFTFVNKCSEPVWVGALGNPGNAPPLGGGWMLNAGASQDVTVPSGWAGRFWGRRNCTFNSAGLGTCETGDCGGRLQCNGAGGVPPTSVAEFTLNGGGNVDFYDVSLVDGYDFPIQITPTPPHPNPSSPYECGTPTCTKDLLTICPTELQKRNAAGKTVACLSACAAFNTDQYCCRGAYSTPSTCNPTTWPKNYAAIFKSACPTQYSYAYDDQLSTFTCGNPSPNYTIIFCL